MKSPFLFCFLLFLLPRLLPAQPELTDKNDPDFNPHAVNPYVSAPLVLGLGYVSARRADKVRSKPRIPLAEVTGLRREDVPGFDRWALDQNSENTKQFLLVSDYVQNVAHASPLALLFWKKYRRNWLDVTLMYFEVQTTQGLIYSYSPFGPGTTNRLRPIAYYDAVSDSDRTEGNVKNSQFSGHVSTMSASAYFMAKMVDDYNPDFTPGQRVLVYGAATVPVAFSGWLRIRALKHFPSDVALGAAVGAFSGVMVPQFHKWWAQRHPNSSAALAPFYGNGAGGVGFTLTY